MQRLELYKFAKLFHDGEVPHTFHRQFYGISERGDAVYDFFERFWYEIIGKNVLAPIKKTQLPYKRRKRKGMCISGIDSLAEL